MSDPLEANTTERAQLLASQQKLLRTVEEQVEGDQATARSQPQSLVMSIDTVEQPGVLRARRQDERAGTCADLATSAW